MGWLSGGDATGPFQDGVGDQGYPVNSSCPSTSRALSIPEIRERIVNLAMPPRDKRSFCRVRAVGRAWRETTFELAKNQDNKYCFSVLLSSDYDEDCNNLQRATEFLEKVTPDALWLPIRLGFHMNKVDVPLATRVAAGYSHLIFEVYLLISKDPDVEALSDLDHKLEFFQGRDYSRLQTINLEIHQVTTATVGEIQKGLDAIERLTGSLTKLRQFKVTLFWCDWAEEDQLILPSRITDLCLYGLNSLQVLVHPRNTLPRVQVLTVESSGTRDPEMHLRHFLQHCRTLKELNLYRWQKTLDEAPLPLFLPQLESLKKIELQGLNYVVETNTGSVVLPYLTTCKLNIELNLEEGEVARLATLGMLLRKANRFKLLVRTSLNASPRMEQVSECFSNVTKLEWNSESGWESLVRPLSHVFRRMTALQEIVIGVQLKTQETPIDLSRLLTGLQESEIPEEEKNTILNGRRDVLTNLRRLSRLQIRTRYQFQPLSPFLFQNVFNAMPELTYIDLNATRPQADKPFSNVQEMVTAWRASGKVIMTTHYHFY